MKLTRLKIKDHLLLHNLDMQFERPGRLDENESYKLDFLVGVNGSGKSTLLRTLVEIFVSLQEGVGAEYEYLLQYELDKDDHPTQVSIDKHWNPGENTWHIVSTILSSDGTTTEQYNSVLDQQYLPQQIIVYTTGSETEWTNLLDQSDRPTYFPKAPEEIIKDPIKRFIHEMPGHINEIKNAPEASPEEPPFLLVKGSRLNVITLCGLLRYLSEPEEPSKKPLASVLEAIGIEKIPGFSLRFRMFDRLSPKTTYEELLKLQNTEIRQASARLLTFDLTQKNDLATTVLKQYNGAYGLYQKLDTLQENDATGEPTLQQVNIFLQRNEPEINGNELEEENHIPGVFLLDWLSDGERAFLSRMALLAMLDMQDSLIILDEPEVHFNDYWKREVVQFIDLLAKGYANQILLTTHSTIVISDVSANQVLLFIKDDDGYSKVIDTHAPLFGADPSYVMTNLLGTGRSGGTYSNQYLKEALERNDKDELQKLMNIVGPGYWRFRISEQLEDQDALSD